MADKPYEPADSPATGTTSADATAVGETPEAGEALATLKRERDDVYDRLLRKTAEFDNYRKRIDRERREQAELATADLLQDVLQVVDDFDLALTAESSVQNLDAYKKGVELIHAKLHDVLKKYGVRPIDAVGAPFDPNLHQAVLHETAPGRRDGEVIDELRRGYMIGDRLLRPAMVKVATAS